MSQKIEYAVFDGGEVSLLDGNYKLVATIDIEIEVDCYPMVEQWLQKIETDGEGAFQILSKCEADERYETLVELRDKRTD